MKHYIVTHAGAVLSFKNATATRDVGLAMNTESAPKQSAFIVTDDDLTQVPSSVLVILHNAVRPEKPITKFSDRATAERRMKGVLEVLAKPGIELAEAPASSVTPDAGTTTVTEDGTETTTNEEGTDMATAKGTRKRQAKKGVRPGRTSAFAGKIIRKVGETTRQEGSLGHNSWKLIRDGMTYEAFIAKGGRCKDLAWDIAKGCIKMEKA